MFGEPLYGPAPSFLGQDYDEGQFTPRQEMSLLGPLNGPLSDPMAPPAQPPTPAPIAPTAPPMAPQGMPMMQPSEMSERDRGLSTIYNTFGGMAGNMANPNNPWELQHAEKLRNFELQNQRMRALQQNRFDRTPASVQEFEYVSGLSPEERELYFTTKRGDRSSVYADQRDDLTELMESMGGTKLDAIKLANGQVETRTGPNGEVGVYDLTTEEFRTDMTPEMIAAGSRLIENQKAEGKNMSTNKWEVIGNVETSLQELADEWESTYAGLERGNAALQMLDEGVVEPGLIQGAVLEFLGMGNADLARFQNLSAQQVFEELQGNTLTPVSDADIRALARLFASANQSPEVARGNLEAFIARKEREQTRKSKRMRRELGRVEDADYRERLYQDYQSFIDFESIDDYDTALQQEMERGQ